MSYPKKEKKENYLKIKESQELPKKIKKGKPPKNHRELKATQKKRRRRKPLQSVTL